MSRHRLRPPPFCALGRRGHRAGVPNPAARGGWSWGHSRARWRCIRRPRARAWRLRWRRSGVGPSRRASRRTSASPVRSQGCRAWQDHLGTGSSFDPVVIQAHAAGREVIESPVLKGQPTPPNPNETGLKDTVMVNPGEITDVLAYVDPTAVGQTYVLHCHILEHEEKDMMMAYT